MHRGLKRLIYGVFFLIALFLLGSGMYVLFRPAPSCFDGIQNQNETGVDCGGPCSALCVAKLAPIILVNPVKYFSLDANHMSFLATIQNQNADIGAGRFDYVFKIYDNQGNLTGSFPGTSFIYGGEVKNITLLNIGVLRSSFRNVSFSVENPQWISATDFRRPVLAIQNAETKADGASLVVDGSIVNQDSVKFSRVQIVALFSSAVGPNVGVSQTEIDNLAPNETRTFTIEQPLIPNIDMAGTKIFAYTLRE